MTTNYLLQPHHQCWNYELDDDFGEYVVLGLHLFDDRKDHDVDVQQRPLLHRDLPMMF